MPGPSTQKAATTRPQGAPPRRSGGGRRRQRSRYAEQMHEKQTLKGIYGIREGQLKHYYASATRAKSETGPTLVVLLELRLDNALYRAGFAPTRKAARQMASHHIVEINGRAVTIPSFRLKVSDVVRIKDNKRKKPLFENFEKRLQNVALPSWLELQPKDFAFNVTAEPTAAEAAIGVDIKSIVEYFAR